MTARRTGTSGRVLGALLAAGGLAAVAFAQAPGDREDQQVVEKKEATEVNRIVNEIGRMYAWRGPAPDEKKANQLFDALKAKFPSESVAPRLAYEAAARKAGWSGKPPAVGDGRTLFARFDKAYPTEPEKDLFDPVDRGNRTVAAVDRDTNLKNLHTRSVKEFAEAMGFGSPRMVRFHNRQLVVEAPKVPFDTTVNWSASDDTDRVDLPRAGGARAGAAPGWPSEEALGGFHLRSQFDFLDPLAFGWVKDREHVVGFVPHFFRAMPAVEPPPRDRKPASDRWVVRRLELVSLLKEEKPAVYVADTLPNLGELKDAERRPLSAFEEDGVARLRDGAELVTQATTNRILMVGAVRAAKQCQACHDVDRGGLLGAFSYELLRDPAVKAARP